jgi:hypothetical protein
LYDVYAELPEFSFGSWLTPLENRAPPLADRRMDEIVLLPAIPEEHTLDSVLKRSRYFYSGSHFKYPVKEKKNSRDHLILGNVSMARMVLLDCF